MVRERALPSIHDRAPLLAFIRDHLGAAGRLDDPAVTLPDEAPRTPGGPSFMAGALDGVMGHHGGSGTDAERASEIAERIVRAAAKPTRRRLRKLYEAMNTDDVLGFIDPLIEALAAKRPSTAAVAQIGTWLASTSPDRGPAKIGIALLGITGAPDGELLHDLGAHEEFTLFAAVAFGNSRSDPEPDLFTLARRVDGWGRIQCVERLRDSTDPAIAQWILREGFRNSVMNEYLAYIAATTGDLATALNEPNPDRELLTAAGDIIDALIMGGPAEDIDNYPAAPDVLARWLAHMDDHAETLGDFITIRTTRNFCDRDDWDHRLTNSTWTPDTRDTIRDHANALLEHPRWPQLVHAGLDSTDRVEFWQAEQAARTLGIDPFDQLLARIDTDPLDGPWFQAWQDADTDRAHILVDRATQLLDLDAIATGPAKTTGMGPGYKPHMTLGWTLQGIRDHPGIGADLISVALQSPSIQNRNGALNALEAWGPGHWTDDHHHHLRGLEASDPDDKVRARAGELFSDGSQP
ncbi:MAG: hypothetical protein GY925_21885 [Actinomycetia bacterium]|nr:hypothetical protein [Actinomycetes bacterium]